ncbi:hypothetical protein HBH98_254500 [Parastagonospora nodorum]|nr:hypothetical protein HBH53_260500 [Parastagonospora nodorum]KAH3956051.1 hypothetical protein HBH51_257030 [Parastagonospora nodorum]KAH4332114.1 hypothetical protein HBH98_254500 [Parastagonospora nodorum]KAH4366690.1 hypothetical protein HBH99_254150 [Parastagonospora nodorum]KAH4893109.1 hypothetical protein HBI80_254190 [Parastagonospora nodorum]
MNAYNRTPCPYLPPEIWNVILSLVGAPAWKELRLSSKFFNGLTTCHLFRTIRFELTEHGCYALEKVAFHPAFSLCVKNLVLERTAGLRDLGKSSKWRWALDLPGCNRRKSAHLPRDDDTKGNEADLLSYRDWLAFPFQKKEELYREYETDRRQYKDQMRQIAESLQIRTLDSALTEISHSERLSMAGANGNIAEIFYQAVSRLKNLTRFSHQPGSIFNKNWGCRWRNIRFRRDVIHLHTSDNEDEDIEALQLSVALHALGQIPQVYKVDRISICVDGPAFWGWKRLRYLWNGQGCGNIRAYREEFGSALEADEVAFWMFRHNREEEQQQKEAYSRRLVSMGHALINLTRLDCVVSEDAYSGALSAAATPLFKLLCGAVMLESVSLTFGRLFNGRSRPGPLSDSDGSATLLGLLAKHKPWSNLRQLQLQVATDKDTLLRFLSAHKEILRILALSHMTLTHVEYGTGFGDTWGSVLTELARSLKIEALSQGAIPGR